MPPIARLTLPVHDRDDEDVIGLDGVENGVREYADETTPHIGFKNPPAVGCRHDFPDGRANLLSKTPTEIAPALIVELDGLRKLQTCVRMEFVPYFASKRSIRR